MKRKTNIISDGTLSFQDYRNIIAKGFLYAENKIPDESIQPASIDLRLDKFGYELSSSFLAINETVNEKLKYFKIKKIDISNGYLFKKNITYLIELQENLKLDKYISGKCNPKSSTGRLDIFCRTISDYNSEYENINHGYKGKIFLEITSKTFNIVFKTGDKLNQLRLRNKKTFYLDDKTLKSINKKNSLLFNNIGKKINPDIKEGLKIKADLSYKNKIVAFKAKKQSPKIYFNKFKSYKIKDYWIPIKGRKSNSIIIEPNEFYILISKEKICIPPKFAAEMIPYDTNIGEFRVHYAGFFDPGFGTKKNGSFAVLEIKTYEVPFSIQDGQNVARLIFEKLAQIPDKLYGKEIKSNYHNQGLALSKHFRIID